MILEILWTAVERIQNGLNVKVLQRLTVYSLAVLSPGIYQSTVLWKSINKNFNFAVRIFENELKTDMSMLMSYY